MYSVCCEAICEMSPFYRAALVGIGERGQQEPVMILEPTFPGVPMAYLDLKMRGALKSKFLKKYEETLLSTARLNAKRSPLTEKIEKFLIIDAMPVDTRHNVKINREALAVWAKEQLK